MPTRRTTRSVLVASLASLACLVLAPASAAEDAVHQLGERRTEIVDLGIPGQYSVAQRINDLGVVAGRAGPSDRYPDGYAFRWENGDVAALPELGYITAMNSRGDIIGPTVSTPDREDHALIWHHDGTVTDLGANTHASAINRRGAVAGSYWPDDTTLHAAMWRDGVLVDLHPSGSAASFAEAINDSGQVLVNSVDSSGSRHADIWLDGVMTRLPEPDTQVRWPPGTVALGLNRKGVTVAYHPVPGLGPSGWFLWDGSGTVAEYRDPGGAPSTVPTGLNDRGDVFGPDFLWQDGNYTRLQPLRVVGECCTLYAHALNRRGQVVGVSPVDESTRHATLWDDGDVIDLGTLPSHRSSVAYDINDRGHITGVAEDPFTSRRAVMWKVRP